MMTGEYYHYDSTPMKCTKTRVLKVSYDKRVYVSIEFFCFLSQNIDCGATLEPP